MMANRRRRSAALPVAQVSTITFADTWAAGDTVTATIGGRDLILTVGTTASPTQIATEFTTAWNESTSTDLGALYAANERGPNIPEFDEITASASSAVVTLTGDTKGKPFSVAVTENTAGTGTATLASVTAAAGPNHWGGVDNWDEGAVPVTGDDVFIDHTDIPILYDLDQSAVTLASLTFGPGLGNAFKLGLSKKNTDGTEYVEHREDYFKCGITNCTINAANVGRIKLNFGTVQTAVNVLATGTGDESGLEAVLLKGTHASNALNVRGSSEVGSAVFGGEVATWATVNVDGSARLRFGAGCTLTTINNDGGALEVNSAVATFTQLAGDTVYQAGGITTLNLRGGNLTYNSNGTLGTALVSGASSLDFSQDLRATTVTNVIDIFGTQCTVNDQGGRIANLRVDLNEGATASQVEWGFNVRLTRGAVA